MKELFSRLWHHPETARKFIVAVIGAVVVAVSVGILPPVVGDYVTVITAFLTALGVYAVANE